MSDKIIGIDLGTTNSCVAVIEGGLPVVIPNSEGYPTTPSVVAFTPDGSKLVGQLAKRQAVMNPERTIESIKRHMGTKDKILIDHRVYSPEQVSALILQKLKKQAQDYLGEKVSKAIVTVPAYFDDAQRLATRDAGVIAGLDIVRIVNEPTSSALTYGLHKINQTSRVVVFDFGGGTFDVTVLEIHDHVLHVKAINGNMQLGGEDFDRVIIDWMKAKLREQSDIDIENNVVALQRFREAAEAAKIELSSCSSALIKLPFIAEDHKGHPVDFEAVLTVFDFNRMTKHLVEAARLPVERVLEDAKLNVSHVDQILLAGGTTRVPAVQQLIRDIFQKDPLRAVNPDEAVAIGAAIQGGILAGELDDILLLDVVPMSLGIETPHGHVANLFRRNTHIPIKKKVVLTNNTDKQKAIKGHIVQGESDKASENKSIARFSIPLPRTASPRSLEYEVTFSVDVDGIFCIDVVDDQTGKKVDIELVRTQGLTREELKDLAEQASLESAEETIVSERNEATMQAQCCLSDAERMLAKNAARRLLAEQAAVRQAMNNVRNAVLEGETSDILKRIEELTGEMSRFGKTKTRGVSF